MNELDRLTEGVVFLRGMKDLLSEGSYRSSLDVIELSGLSEPGTLTFELVEDIRVRRLHIRFALDEGAWSISVNINEQGTVTIHESGPIEEVFEPADASHIARAVSDKDTETLLHQLSSNSLHVSISVVNDPEKSRVHYLERVGDFENRLLAPSWRAFISQISMDSLDLVIGDAVGRIECGGFCLSGPNDVIEKLEESVLDEPPSTDSRPPLPSPLYFAPLSGGHDEHESLSKLADWLHGISRWLVWYWIATNVRVEPDRVQLEFISTRVVVIGHSRPSIASSSQVEMEIFQWSLTAADPARVEAMRQAVTLAAEGDNPDLAQIAVPALRTAKSLYQVAKQGIIAEALATRRAARQAAFNAATDAAKAAREASAKAVERVVVQLAAAIGVLIANAKDLVSAAVSMMVLLIVALISIVTWRSSSKRDIELAEQTLAAMSEDLNEYREALSSADIDAIREMRTVSSTKSYLVGAKVIVRRLALSVFAGCVIAAVYVILGSGRVKGIFNSVLDLIV